MPLTFSGVILAAGQGTRINSKKVNKVVYKLLGKSLVCYAQDLLQKSNCDPVIVVVGCFEDSVKKILQGKKVVFAKQKKPLGTGDALKFACPYIQDNCKYTIVAYGDHAAFYNSKIVKKLARKTVKEKAVIGLISVKPDAYYAWGRIIKDRDGNVTDIIEEADCTPKQKQIRLLNAGLYCFNTKFLKENINLLPLSTKGEYYLTDMVKVANIKSAVAVDLQVDSKYVGIGVNTRDQLYLARKMKSSNFMKK